MILVAHNAKAADFPMLCRALDRAGLPPLATFTALGVTAVADSLLIARGAVVWDASNKFTVEEVDNKASYMAEAAKNIPMKKKVSAPVVIDVEHDEPSDGEIEYGLGEMADAGRRKNGLMDVYRQLFGHEFADALEATNDVHALEKVLQHPTMWNAVYGNAWS
jgi:hypothetical protein